MGTDGAWSLPSALALACFLRFFSQKMALCPRRKIRRKWRLFERPALSLTDLAFFAKNSQNLSGEKTAAGVFEPVDLGLH
jgi:hypothetical protein